MRSGLRASLRLAVFAVHWTLVVEGPKANYSFFGDLVQAP
jgi:hypothetical protein